MLFGLKRNPKFKGQVNIPAGHKWIEVLAIVPVQAVQDEEEEGFEGSPSWTIFNNRVCRTEDGIRHIPEMDVFSAMRTGEYREAK
jgi:hypothetical protein